MTTVSCPVQWNLYNKDTTRTTVSCPVYGGVLISEDSNVHMGQSNGVLLKEVAAFQRCPLIDVSLYIWVI